MYGKRYGFEDAKGHPFVGLYPESPTFSDRCNANSWNQTLPNSWPKRKTAMGPTNLLHLYGPPQAGHPRQLLLRPEDTMYGVQFASFDRAGNMEALHFQAYPFHSFNGWEYREYKDYIPQGDNFEGPNGIDMLPIPFIYDFTRYSVARPN